MSRPDSSRPARRGVGAGHRRRGRRAWAAISKAPRSSWHRSSGPRTSSANQSVMSTSSESNYRRPQRCRTRMCRESPGSYRAQAMFPGAHEHHPQAGRGHGRLGSGRHLPRARCGGQPGVTPVPFPWGSAPATTWRSASRTCQFRARLRRVLRRPLLHGDELATDDRRDGLHHRRLRRAGLRDLRLQGGPGRRARGCAGRWRGTFMLDGAIDGYEPRGRPCATAQPDTPGRGANRGSGTCSRRATGRPKGIEALSGAPIGSADPVLLLAGLYGGTADTVASPRPAVPLGAAALPWRSTGWAARRW